MVGALGIDAGLDFLTGGKLNKYKRKAALAVYRAVVRPAVTRGAIPAAVSIGRTALGVSRLAMLNPYVLGATAIYVGYHERERIKMLLDQGYEFVQEQAPPIASELLQVTQPGREELLVGIGARPITTRLTRKPSSFNKAVKAGMAAVKKSTSYGKKGTISPAKKAFSVVVKLASAKLKKKKAPKSGIRRRIWHAMRL